MLNPASPEPSMLDTALACLANEWSIIPVCTPIAGQNRCIQGHGNRPCRSPGKEPLVRWAEFQTRVAEDAEVRQWWSRWPTANIGLVTGSVSGICVIDIDGEVAKQQALRLGFELGPWVLTGRIGGRHLYFRHRDDAPTIFASAGGIDFRGEGGFVLLPPSLHSSGNTYRWGQPVERGEPLPPLPRWIDDMGGEKRREPIDSKRLYDTGIPEGEREITIFRYASKLRGEDVPYPLALEMIYGVADRCRPPFDRTEARAKVDNAYARYTPNVYTDDFVVPAGHTVDTATGEVLDEPWTFTVRSASEFARMDLPAIEWLVDGLIREQGIVGNFGGPGSLKTYFGTQLGICVSLGRPFLNFGTKQTRVLIVQEDTAESDYQQVYFRPMLATLGITPEQLDGQLYVAASNDMLLDDQERVAALDAWMTEYKPGLVILDAFFLLHQGEGMTAKDLGPILRTLKRLRKKHKCAIWIIDHNRKSPGSGGGDDDPIDRWYGGRPKSAATDGAIESRSVKGQDSMVEIRVAKMRGGQKLLDPFMVKIEEHVLHVVTTGEALAEGVRKVYEWLLEQNGIPRTINEMVEGTRLSERTVRDARSGLDARGWIEPGAPRGQAKTWMAVPVQSQDGAF